MSTAVREGGLDRLEKGKVQITWGMLFDQVYKQFSPAEDREKDHISHRNFLRRLFTDEFADFVDVLAKSQASGKGLSYVFRGANGANKRFQDARTYLIGLTNASREPCIYGDCAFLDQLARRWEELLCLGECSEERRQQLEETIGDLLNGISFDDTLKIVDRLSTRNQEGAYGEVLASLSVIASTLFCWGRQGEEDAFSPEDVRLQKLALPPLNFTEISYSLEKARRLIEQNTGNIDELNRLLTTSLHDPHEKGEAHFLLSCGYEQVGDREKYEAYLKRSADLDYEPAKAKWNTDRAKEALRELEPILARGMHASDSEIQKCCEQCQNILAFLPLVDRACAGQASFILYRYSDTGRFQLPPNDSPQRYLNISNECGYPEAAAEWKKHNCSRLLPLAERSEEPGTGTCFVNCGGPLVGLFQRTMPRGWGERCVRLFTPEGAVDWMDERAKKFLLIGEDYSRNLHDMLVLMQDLKDSAPEPERVNLTFYLRDNRETARAIVDTALSHLEDYRIPVYVINDEQMAAQQLLSEHPLFYPISAMRFQGMEAKPAEERPELHFVVLGSSLVAEWLVREAFWMMGMREDWVRCNITVLAPDGEQFVSGLKSRFPGLSRDRVQIPGVPMPEIAGKSVRFDSCELAEIIHGLAGEQNTYCYFAVATEEDERNLALAMQTRELLIREKLVARDSAHLDRLPPIAFYCRDEAIAWISGSMVIEQEALGNRWYNTWSLIAFGADARRYAWDKLDGGTFEQLAKCIHYQYAGLSPEDVRQNTEKALAADRNYYRRQYFRDSSYSLALSMPYRLFQFRDRRGNQIVPLWWSILDSSVFADVEQLKHLSEELHYLEAYSEADTEYTAVAIWEHNRWIRWMLSRGWLPATPEDAVFACQCGNARQQLFVARLHPCICAYEAQKELSDTLFKQCGLQKDFYTYDLANIKDTRRLLALEWVREREENIR